MKSLKGYFKAGKTSQPGHSPAISDATSVTLAPSLNPHRRTTSRTNSSFAAGSFRNDEEIKSMKTEVMAEWLYKQQRLKLWASSGPEEGVILKKSRGEYTCCPEDLRYMRGGIFEQIVNMNVACAMTINTNVISIFVSSQPGDSASLQGGLSVQILPSISYLSGCLKHQFAAFIRDRAMLIVWDDDPEKVIEHTTRLETLLMMTIWNDGANYADDEKELTTERIDEMTSLEKLEEGLRAEEPRHLMFISPMVVAGTLILTLATLGLGWRKLALEVAVDGNYIRLGLLVFSPIVFFVGLFSMQSIMGCLFQIFGPVKQVMVNSRAYSGRAPKRIIAGPFPHITVQMPVYKEGLNAVIKPTIMSIKAAISTYELQGGTANIFVNDDGMQVISKEDAHKRQDFYDEHNIGWVARPKHYTRPKKPDADFDESLLFTRRGKFKKASNMNYALMVSNCVEEKLANIPRHSAWTKENENEVYAQCFSEVLEELNGRAWAAGNVRVGDYILIIDSDTRVPKDCLLDAASEMEQSPEVAIIQFSSGVMNMTSGFFEAGITFFTNLIYTAIRFAVASGDVCPFVGHNALLRWSALQQVTYTDEDGYEKFWSESHVSEDFDMALRLQCLGYKIRLAAYQGDGFKEGVSLTVYDELARWEKYAYGCNELLFHPIRKWPWKGPFTPLFKKFVASSMPIHAKLTIMAYICTYYALGAGWLLTVGNYFIMGWFAGYIDQFYLDSFAIYCGMIVIFTGLSNISLAVLRYRTGEKGLIPALWENFKWVPLLMIFLGGISLHISQALLSHMFEINMQWGATAKEVENTTFFKEMPKLLKKFRFTFVFCILMIGLMVAGVFFFPALWRINTLVAIYPLATLVTGHMLLPIVLNPALMMFTW